MLKKFCIFAIFTLLFVSVSTAEETWMPVLKTEIKSADNVAGIAGVFNAGFIDESHGFATFWHNVIYSTTDGGKKWIKSVPSIPFESSESLEILNADIAWTGVGFGLSLTTNGGRNWKYLSEKNNAAESSGNFLSFADSKNGWHGTYDKLFVTRDGGVSWKGIPVPPEAGQNIIAVDLLSEKCGYILLNNGVLYQTKNNGRDWVSMRLPLQNRKVAKPANYTPVEALRFLDEKRGTAVLYLEKPVGFAVFQTIDGGKNWVEEKLPSGGKLLIGSAFLSRDGKYLTINNINNKEILLYKHGK